MIKNIIFDLSEVIMSGYIGFEKYFEAKTGYDSEQFLRRKLDKIDDFYDLMRNKISEEEYWSLLLEGQNYPFSPDDMSSLVREYLGQPIPGVLELIQTLKSTNQYRLILLSDYPYEWKEYILKKKPELLVLFDDLLFSSEFGSLKYDDGSFEYVIKTLGIKPQETIFVDDSEQNVDKARKSGIKSIQFHNAKQLSDDLKNLLADN